jgi:dihydroorotate dehydrogenase electron transfer subunit
MKHYIPKSLKIKEVIEENSTTKTFVFEYALGSKPGQFVMMWLAGVDQCPMSIGWDDGKQFAVTVCAIGGFSKSLCEKKAGDYVGITGPFGTQFRWKEGEHIALVGGGYGAAPMYFCALEAMKDGCTCEFLIGARNEDLLLYRERFEKIGVPVHVSTDDGSVGHKGYVTELLSKLIDEKKVDAIFTCGPEMMEKAVSDIGHEKKVNTQIAVERYMKCGYGLCGQCCIDGSGVRACTQGSVMPNALVRTLEEFGKYNRDAEGRKVYF